jgi:UDP-N-acetylmuramoylalanine--D-glutamate ligase
MLMKDKKVTVVGLARSGTGAAKLLALLGADVTVTDKRSGDELQDMLKGLGPEVKRVLGGHREDIFTSADLIVISPGVPLEIAPLASARAKGIPVISELELAYKAVMNYGLGIMGKGEAAGGGASLITDNPSPFLAVTGSNGKSTTTTLLDHMMRKAGFRTVLGGNIGNALTEEILKIVADKELNPEPDFFVVEVSSFQLDAIESFRPHIASILNITPDHLDRYHAMTGYRNAKARIYLNQRSSDFLVLNADDPGVIDLYELHFKAGKGGMPKVYFFSRAREVEGIHLREGQVYCNLPGAACTQGLISCDEIRIKGVHNLENAMAAAAMALLAGCPPGAVKDSLKEFGGLEHRLELVRELDGVTYINDSKGTNVGAVIKSIESFREPLILIAGGRDKAGDFSALRELVSQKVKTVILIGEASDKIEAALGDVTHTLRARDLAEAVTLSRQLAEKGDVVLLSPACASFDMFRDYEDRGRQFKEKVMEMKKEYV